MAGDETAGAGGVVIEVPTPNVALFPSSFDPHIGGVEELSKRLALNLAGRGSKVAVITNRYPIDLPADSVVDSLPVHRARFRFPEPKPRHLAGWVVGTRTARQSVLSAVRENASDVVHVQCVSTNGYYALRAARSASLPLVVSLQGELTMDASQIYQRSAAMRRHWRRLLGAADVVTGCSQQVVDEAIEAYGPGLAEKARVVRNGVDLERVRAAAPEVRARPYLLGIGRFVPQKGFDVLIDAFDHVADAHPDLDLVLAGDGPEAAALRARAAGTRHADRIEFTGGVPAERAFALFRGAAGFVLASRHEPQGIVVIEAMAAGTPVVATRVGGVPETVVDGVNGLLVGADNARSMAEGISRLLDDPLATRSRVATATHTVSAYTWSQIAQEYLDCYRDARSHIR